MSQILNSNDLKTCLILLQIDAFAVCFFLFVFFFFVFFWGGGGCFFVCFFSYSKILELFLQILALSQIGCCYGKQVELKKKKCLL